jgi:TonB-linked SusC/RagA family outer membrane protein
MLLGLTQNQPEALLALIINQNKNNMKRIYLIFFVILGLIGNSLYGQERRVTGTVTQLSDGSTLPGVTVRAEGTTLGTITDMNGRYEITVPGDVILVFSFVGMNTESVPVNNREIVNVAMVEDVSVLQEIVVTALGISRERKSLGYTVQEVGGEDLVRGENPDLMTALSGKVSGLEVRQSSGMPGAPSSVLIRGARSFSGNNNPMYVVDGMPIVSDNDYGANVTGANYTNRALDINPNDIETITVLKGQAAAALYGLRASNGVILITTKRGASGAPGKPVVSITSGVTVDNVASLPEVQQTYAQGTWNAVLGRPVFAPTNSFSWGPRIDQLPDQAISYNSNGTVNTVYAGNELGQPGMYFDPYKGQWVTPQAYNNPENFYNQNGVTWNNNISVSQSTGNGNFSMGIGSTNQEGIVPGTLMDRYTARFAGDFNLTKMWDVGFSGNYSKSEVDKLPSGNDSWLFTVYGAPPSFDLAGTPFHQEGDFGEYRQISYRRGAVGVNPYWALENNTYAEATNRFFGNSYVEFKPINNFKIRYQLGADSYTTDNYIYREAGLGDLPAAGQYPTPANPVYGIVTPTGGSIENFGLTRSVINSLLTTTLTLDLNDDIGANLLLGNEIDHNTSEYYTSEGQGFTTPGWANLDNTNTKVSAYESYARRTVGFFGNLDLNYKTLLYLTATARQDIVSSMPRNNRSFFYPSANLSFVFTELDGLVDNPILPFGKIRLSYAEVGQAAQTYLANPPFVTGGATSGFLSSGIIYPWQGITGYKPSATLYDPNLVPQNTQTYEVGFDLSFLNNRIGLDYTYFDQLLLTRFLLFLWQVLPDMPVL